MTRVSVVTGAVTTAIIWTRDHHLLQGHTLMMVTQSGLSTPGSGGSEARILSVEAEVNQSSPEKNWLDRLWWTQNLYSITNMFQPKDYIFYFYIS